MSATIAACSTAPGAGAIAIVRLSGPEAISAADFFFHPKNGASFSSLKPRTVYYGEFSDACGRTLDFCTAFFVKGPRSYTGEDVVEINCHGSQALVAEVLSNLYAHGVRPAEAGEFTKRAFLNGRMDLFEAEAVADLISAESAAEVRNAAAQLKGALGETLKSVRGELLQLVSHFYAAVDFPDEGVDPFMLDKAKEVLEDCIGRIGRLYRTFDRGRFLKEGIPVVIAGKPNVGKSSLLNALCGEDKAIVTHHPGTTRDIVEARLRTPELTLHLMDTAGIRESADELERLGIVRSERALSEAYLAVCVFDASSPLDENDLKVMELCRDIPSIAVLNKSDLPGRLIFDGREEAFDEVIALSAKTGEGIDRLVDVLKTRIHRGASEESIITNARQANALRRAAERLNDASASIGEGMTPDAVVMDIEGALAALGEITGETVREEIIENIFSRFCVGK